MRRWQLDCVVQSEDSDGLRLLSNRFRGGGGGAGLNGDGIVAERNSFELAGGISIEGADANVTGNHFEACIDGVAVKGKLISSSRRSGKATVTWNTLKSGGGIVVETDSPVIENNTVTIGGAITVECTPSCPDGRIVRNRLSRVRFGIFVSGSRGPQIEANQIQQVRQDGIYLDEAIAANVANNRVTDTGGRCIVVVGANENTVSGNTLTDCSAGGIDVGGDRNTVERNRISGTSDDGIEIGGMGNAVLDNRVSGAIDNGITIGGSVTTVSGNQVRGLRFNDCDGGSGTVGTDVPDSTTGCGDFD